MRSVRTNSRVPASFDEPTARDYTRASSSGKRTAEGEMLLFWHGSVICQTYAPP